ncbi:LysR family transcriptional regulator [Janthinobacterium sp. RT4P48]|uniref:LysR family transcriptional regulator n=1 Tax=Janthinobacterium sp. RT4P48 TaxID=3424188 RepID=UPI003F2086EB
MEGLGGIAMFVQVADSGSFSATGRLLGLSSSAVGKSVARMETRLGARLFQRSTRHLALTDEGEKFLQRCKRILAEVEAAEQELSAASGAPSGRLRISLPRYSGLFEPVIAGFMLAYPDIELDLDFSDALVNVISDGFDAVVRTGELDDSGLTRRKLCTFRRLLVASPAYLARHGHPAHPADLARHQRLRYRFPATGRLEAWPLDDTLEPAAPLAPGMVCNSVEMRVYLALQGQGIAYLPAFTVQRELAAGQLVSLLDAHTQPVTAFWLLWPASRHLPPRLRVFIDFLVQQLQDQTYGTRP